MARWEIEPSGCCEHKGMVQVRFCFYLEPGDARYSEHHVNLPIFPESGYPGKKDEHGMPKSQTAYRKWRDGLPHVWQTNPFHNHFIYVDPETTDEEIASIGDELLPVFYSEWLMGKTPGQRVKPPVFAKQADNQRRSRCKRRADGLRGRS